MRYPMPYPIPYQSGRAFTSPGVKGPQNAALVFDRFAPDWSEDGKLKKPGLEAVCSAVERADRALLTAWVTRWRKSAEGVNAMVFPARTDWRFIPGLGRKGPLEVGFAFHRYGFPMLPGSSVKGIARAYASLAKDLDESDTGFAQVFGRAPAPGQDQSLAQSGRAVFLDAIPAELPSLELDVMTPHFPEYYHQGKAAPTDDQSPIPVYFLTVAPNTKFLFAVGWRGPLDDAARRLRDLAKEWLVGGLTQLGAGAKTSAGYGYFVETDEPKAISAEPAPAPATRAPMSVPVQPEPPLSWRTGTVREYHPDKGWGRLADVDTGKELRFDCSAIEDKGWSPGKKSMVTYAVPEQADKPIVMRVRRKT